MSDSHANNFESHLRDRRKISICFLGCTGDGKSASANLFLTILQDDLVITTDFFGEGHTASSHTHCPKMLEVNNVIIIDFPGLQDSGGDIMDEKNIVHIVEFLKNRKSHDAFFFVLNYQNPKFNNSYKLAVSLLVNSLSPDILQNIAFLFTRCAASNAATEIQKKINQTGGYLENLNNATGYPLANIPFFFVDCYPDQLSIVGSPSEYIEEVRNRNKLEAYKALHWARTLTPVDTTKAKVGQYAHKKAIDDAKQEAGLWRAESDRRQQEIQNLIQANSNKRRRNFWDYVESVVKAIF